jgi:cation:H+ antiporter
MDYFLLLLGFILLIKGADLLIDGASGLAKSLGLSPMIIGLSIVAFGTSAPEAAISISAALQGSDEIALSNIVGSNIFNVAVVIGIMILLKPLSVDKQAIHREIPFALLSCILLLILILFSPLKPVDNNIITRSDGLIFLAFFSLFIYYLFRMSYKNSSSSLKIEKKPAQNKNRDKTKQALYFIIGLAGIILGGKFVVDSSVAIALSWGISETLIALTIIAAGTSLPELVAGIAAVIKRQTDIAIGNIIGSTIFNILFVLGITSVITPIAATSEQITDTVIMIILHVLLLIFVINKPTISKKEGFVLLMSYLAFLAFIIIR